MRLKRRIYETVEIENKRIFTLFDSGARLSCITEKAIEKTKIQPQEIESPFNVKLGRDTHTIKQVCIITGTIRKKNIHSV